MAQYLDRGVLAEVINTCNPRPRDCGGAKIVGMQRENRALIDRNLKREERGRETILWSRGFGDRYVIRLVRVITGFREYEG